MENKDVFVVTPIGKKGTERYEKFLAICKNMIEPTLKKVDPQFKLIRADQIAKPGSFVKDILEYLRNSHIVIANLTDLNPNVFYELGVRHCLSNRTIMITEDLDTLPSDLKEYRAIEYAADITGITEFQNDLEKSLKEILKSPETPDNPVQDRIGQIIKTRESQLQGEIEKLNAKLQGKRKTTPQGIKGETTRRRVERILSIWEAQRGDSFSQEWIDEDENGKKKSFYIKEPEGNFTYYFLDDENGEEYCLVISVHNTQFSLEIDLADIRVMLSKYDKIGSARFKFTIATEEDLKSKKTKIDKFFNSAVKAAKINNKERFSIEIWDVKELLNLEKTLGIRI